MPFSKGHGGRPRGARNKVGREVRDLWAELGGPDGEQYAQALSELALTDTDPYVRVKALAIIAPYVWTKKVERIEVTGADGGPIEVHDHFDSSVGRSS